MATPPAGSSTELHYRTSAPGPIEVAPNGIDVLAKHSSVAEWRSDTSAVSAGSVTTTADEYSVRRSSFTA